MSAAHATVDLDDTDGLVEADRDGLLRAAAMAGAQVRATAATVDEGGLDQISGGQRPRTVIWLAGRGPAVSAGAMLAAALGATAGEPLVLAADSLPWIGPLDVLVVAGDDPGAPVLGSAAATAVRRGARVVVATPAVRAKKRRMLTALVVSSAPWSITLSTSLRPRIAAVTWMPPVPQPNGSGISLGHPIGATGAIITVKALYELERIGGRYALVTMCIGGGQGIAAIFERV
jgi:hypothetical protein